MYDKDDQETNLPEIIGNINAYCVKSIVHDDTTDSRESVLIVASAGKWLVAQGVSCACPLP